MITKYKKHLSKIQKRNTTIADYARKTGLNPQSLYQAKSKLDKQSQQATGHRPVINVTNGQFIELPPPKDRPIKIVRRMELEQEVDGLWSLKLSLLHTNDIRSIISYISNP